MDIIEDAQRILQSYGDLPSAEIIKEILGRYTSLSRDTQFQGFARLLVEELDGLIAETDAMYIGAQREKNNEAIKQAVQTIIARRAYDLMLHGAFSSSLLATMEECKRRVVLVPDMTAWPKEMQS